MTDNEIIKAFETGVRNCNSCSYGITTQKRKVLNLINRQRAEIPFDCYPSEHGRYDGRTKCSVCGIAVSRLYYKYCPCCGARMDGETNEI